MPGYDIVAFQNADVEWSIHGHEFYHDAARRPARAKLRQRYNRRMKPLHTARHVTEAHLIRGFLESQGVNAVVRGEYLSGGIGELPLDLCKVWVIEDREFARADDLLRQYLQGDAARAHAHEHWHCAPCNENLEGQFTACWKCGSARPG